MIILHSSMQAEDIIEKINVKCHVFIIQRARGRYHGAYQCQYISKHTNSKCHEVTLMVKLLTGSVTWYKPCNRASDTILYGTLYTTNNVVEKWVTKQQVSITYLRHIKERHHLVCQLYKHVVWLPLFYLCNPQLLALTNIICLFSVFLSL